MLAGTPSHLCPFHAAAAQVTIQTEVQIKVLHCLHVLTTDSTKMFFTSGQPLHFNCLPAQ